MPGSAPYEVTVSRTDDATFSFMFSLEMTDGAEFPFSEYDFEYILSHCGSPVLRLTQGSGISVVAPTIEFKSSEKIGPGVYQHGCRMKHIETGEQIQLFSGSVTITEGGF